MSHLSNHRYNSPIRSISSEQIAAPMLRHKNPNAAIESFCRVGNFSIARLSPPVLQILIAVFAVIWPTLLFAQSSTPHNPPSVTTATATANNSSAQTVQTARIVPWEYSPYRCKVWVSFSPKLRLHDGTQTQIFRAIRERLEADFGGTCIWDVQKTPDSLFSSVLYRIEDLTFAQLLSRETTLVVAKSEAAKQNFLNVSSSSVASDVADEDKGTGTKLTAEQQKELEDARARAASINSVRTLESALERIPSIAILPLGYAGLQREAAPHMKDPRWQKLTERLSLFDGNLTKLQASLESGETLAALVPKSDVAKLQDSARPIPTRFPWQPEAMLRESDKIFMISVDAVDELYSIKVRELDAYLNHLGPISTLTTPAINQLKQLVSFQVQNHFSTLVRVEETDPHTATLRVRAGELIVGAEHPAKFDVGDVLLPFIRRTDVNDNATLIQPIPFTYVAATEKIDKKSLFYGAIFTASQGALTAAKNRRTQRLGLKVKSLSQQTELTLSYRPTIGTPLNSPPATATGIELFERVPGTDGMLSIGRTDWRGKIKIAQSSHPTIRYRAPHTSLNQAVALARQTVLEPTPAPEYIETTTSSTDSSKDKSVASLEKQPTDDSQGDSESNAPKTDASGDNANPPDQSPAEPASQSPTEDSEETGPSASENGDSAPPESPATTDSVTTDSVATNGVKKIEGEVTLNVPLYLYYIKSGDVLLARMPIVIGATDSVTATLPDDRRRLETEAYLKGLQSEILDLVVRRKILESRFEKFLADGKTDEAKVILEELKRMKSYDRITEELIQIQNRALTPERGQLGPNLENRIRSMTATTRELIDKWLQEDLVRKFESKLSK